MSDLQHRINLAMKEAGVTAADLVRACGVKASSVSDWTTGVTKSLKGTSLVRAAKALKVNETWLATGRGPMRPDEEPMPDADRADFAIGQLAAIKTFCLSILHTHPDPVGLQAVFSALAQVTHDKTFPAPFSDATIAGLENMTSDLSDALRKKVGSLKGPGTT